MMDNKKAEARKMTDKTLSLVARPRKATGSVALVGAGPGAKDLITLRGLQKVQQADVIFYDRLVDPEIMDFARPEADCIYVGKKPGCHSWPQSRINAALIKAAQCGQRVVRLKCGDPGIFARGAEEIAALEAAGIPFEIVPGVTAASAAAAAQKAVLTERGEVDTLILTTGHLDDGPHAPDWLARLAPGTCVALYMAVSSAPMIAAQLRKLPHREAIEVTIVANAQKPDQQIIPCTPEDLPQALARHNIKNTAMIFLKLPKSAIGTLAYPAQTPQTPRVFQIA